jgi:hypothetical protein
MAQDYLAACVFFIIFSSLRSTPFQSPPRGPALSFFNNLPLSSRKGLYIFIFRQSLSACQEDVAANARAPTLLNWKVQRGLLVASLKNDSAAEERLMESESVRESLKSRRT